MRRPEEIEIEFVVNGFGLRVKGYDEKKNYKNVKYVFSGKFDERDNEFLADIIKNALIDVLNECFYVKKEEKNE